MTIHEPSPFHVRSLLALGLVPLFVPTAAAMVVAALAIVVFALTGREDDAPRHATSPVSRPRPQLDALSSPDELEVLDAIEATVQRGEQVPTLVLYHPSPVVVRRALSAIDERRDLHNVMPYLLTHRDESVRSLARARTQRGSRLLPDLTIALPAAMPAALPATVPVAA